MVRMAVVIRLLGRPCVETEGRSCGPRGNKAWGLLAYLLLCERAASRRRITELLFADADDPLGTLRWNLAELRRSLGGSAALTGDPIRVGLAADVSVDVYEILHAAPEKLATIGEHEGELLEGIGFPTSPAFEAWLLPQRRRVAVALEAVLRERVLLDLAAGPSRDAPQLAARLVSANPYEEAHHELLIRALLAVGDRSGAATQFEACEALFRRELGCTPSRHLSGLVQPPRAAAAPMAVGGAAAAEAQLEAGRAALAAGAADAGIELLRGAAEEASSSQNALLYGRVLLALGSGLVHTTRGHEEGATVLHRAAAMALRQGAAGIAATAYREIGFIDVQAGRRERAEVWLTRAEEAAAGASEELASIYGVRGMNLSDSAHYAESLAALERSIEHGQACDGKRQTALSISLIGRVHLLQGRTTRAREALARAQRTIEDARWIAFRPWPEMLLAEIDLRDGRLDPARNRLEYAFTLACQLGDSCWEGGASRGLGIVEARRGRMDAALAWLTDARARCTRVPAPWQWMHGWIVDALCAAAIAAVDPRAAEWVASLEALAQRSATRELLVHAYVHRGALGDSGGLRAARLLAAEIENPRLEERVATVAP